MTDDRLPEDEDLGPPAVELQLLRETTDKGFLARLRAAIYRRNAAGQFLDFSFPMFFSVLMEYVSMLFTSFGGGSRKPPDQSPPPS